MRRALLILALAGASMAQARDYLDTTNGRGWAPDSTWLAFNPVGQDELFVMSLKTNTTYLLKPIGDVSVDSRNVFAGMTAGKTAGRGLAASTLIVGSPGRSKLQALEWSPDSRTLVYSIDRKTRGVFSVFDQIVGDRLTSSEMLPWQADRDVRVTFELSTVPGSREARYWLRVVRPDGIIVKEVAFDDPREIRQVSLLRLTDASVLSPNKQFLLYPKHSDKGWQLVIDPVSSNESARGLSPMPAPPLAWKLAPDNRCLVVAESDTTLAVGLLDDWERAERVSLPNLATAMAWSSDGWFLACNARNQLYLLGRRHEAGRLAGELQLISEYCTPTFWGWRGSRLYFGDVRAGSTSLYVVDTEQSLAPELIVTPRKWQSAPHERTISPDGSMFVCLMMEQDNEGRLTPQVWKIDLRPVGKWEKLYTFNQPQ